MYGLLTQKEKPESVHVFFKAKVTGVPIFS